MECIQAPYRLIFYYFPVSSNRLFIQTHMQHNYLQWMNPFLFECAPEISFHAWIFVAWCVHIVRLINSKRKYSRQYPFDYIEIQDIGIQKIPKKWTIKMSLLCVQCTGWLNFHIENSILWWFGGGNDDTTTTDIDAITWYDHIAYQWRALHHILHII